MLSLIILIACPVLVLSANNGLARTPPMGWLTWERFRCNTDCQDDPDNCISENLIKTMADHMVSDGYKDAGYEYVCIDDCWPSHERGPDGRLVPDPQRFPSGMKALADYVHAKGLKLGIYEDFGTETCAKYPGSEFYLKTDAETFADWGIDLLKFDTCNSYSSDFQYGFPAMEFFLNQTGRPILFSCEWPHGEGGNKNFTAISETCNMWRTGVDVEDSWDSILGVIDFYAKNEQNFSTFSGPGGWADPDMLAYGDVMVFTRTLNGNKVAVALVNRSFKGMPTRVTMTGKDVGLTDTNGYTVTDGFTGEETATYGPDSQITLNVNPTGIVLFVATPKSYV